MIIAESYLERILKSFNFTESPCFCQIATVAKKQQGPLPNLRTVQLFYDPNYNALRFTTSTQTRKWSELKSTPTLCGLFYDATNTTQYCFSGDTILIDKQTTEEENYYQYTWQNLRPSVRHKLWQEYLADPSQQYDIKNIFPNHGVVLIKPYQWDIFNVDINDFTKSDREQLFLKDGQWQIYTNAPAICPVEFDKI